MATRTIGTIASAHSRLEKPSGVPLRLQCVATVGGSCGYAQIDIATASAAITRPNQRLRIAFSPVFSRAEAGHEVAHDFLKHSRVEPVADELSLALRGDQICRFEHPEVVRDRRKRDRELFGDLARGAILFGQQLKDLAPGWIGEGAKQRVIHWGRHLYNYLNIVK